MGDCGSAKPKRRCRPPSKVVSRRKNLSKLIEQLPSVEVERADIKALALQLILDTPNDDPKKVYAYKGKLKLDALKLLADLTADQDGTDAQKELLDILRGE